MASSSSTLDSTHRSQSQSQSRFIRTITLLDWWLIKTDTKNRLGVSGTTSTPREVVRVFSSAPIAIRHDVFTVETADAVCVVLRSFINTQRTLENGFPSQVAESFAIGFPVNWERYAEEYCGEDPAMITATELETLERDKMDNSSSAIPEVPKTIHDSMSCVTIQPRGRADVSGQSPTRSEVTVPENLSSGMRGRLKEKRMTSCQSKTEKKKLNISNPERDSVQNDCCELGGGIDPFEFTEELQQPVITKVTELASNSKRVCKPQNLRPKVIVEDNAKEDSTTRKKAKWKSPGAVMDSAVKETSTPRNKTKRKIKFDEQATPEPRQVSVSKCVVPPECLSIGRSRSGRILLPSLEFWRNQIPVYDLDRNVTGIQEERSAPVPGRGGSRSKPRKKR